MFFASQHKFAWDTKLVHSSCKIIYLLFNSIWTFKTYYILTRSLKTNVVVGRDEVLQTRESQIRVYQKNWEYEREREEGEKEVWGRRQATKTYVLALYENKRNRNGRCKNVEEKKEEEWIKLKLEAKADTTEKQESKPTFSYNRTRFHTNWKLV